MMKTYITTYGCGHSASYNTNGNYAYHEARHSLYKEWPEALFTEAGKGIRRCPLCIRAAKILLDAGVKDLHLLQEIGDWGYKTPTGRPKGHNLVKGEIARRIPESLPILVTKGYEFASRALDGDTQPAKRTSKAAEAAALIRKALKEAPFNFAHKDFNVKCSNYAGGSSIHIQMHAFIPGHLVGPLNDLAHKFQYGHFDGMTDCYEADNINKDIPQVSYVHVRGYHGILELT